MWSPRHSYHSVVNCLRCFNTSGMLHLPPLISCSPIHFLLQHTGNVATTNRDMCAESGWSIIPFYSLVVPFSIPRSVPSVVLTVVATVLHSSKLFIDKIIQDLGPETILHKKQLFFTIIMLKVGAKKVRKQIQLSVSNEWSINNSRSPNSLSIKKVRHYLMHKSWLGVWACNESLMKYFSSVEQTSTRRKVRENKEGWFMMQNIWEVEISWCCVLFHKYCSQNPSWSTEASCTNLQL